MNHVLEGLALELGLAEPNNERLRLDFAYACAERVRHLLEEPSVVGCLDVLGRFLHGQARREVLEAAKREAAALANRHQGSKSIDGCGHAAVSATYAVAKALEGKALEAASYAAYAAVYAQGGSAAVADRESFETEFSWQAMALGELAGKAHLAVNASRS
jgi:hypothetical protein